MITNKDQIKVREYLLGYLSDDEQEKIEERLMTDEELFEELEISKNELIEEYRAGELTQADQQRFGSGYLATPEGRSDYTFAMALECMEKPAPVPKTSNFLNQLASFFTPQRLKFAAVGLSALIVIAIAALVLRPGPQKSLALTLTSAAARRSASDPKIQIVTIGSDVKELRVTLTLPQPASQSTNYRAELDDRSQTKNVTLAAHDAGSVVVVIPASQLPAGYYALRLYAVKSDGNEQRIPGDYYFMVEKN
jgi:methionine-rich copper-binding protein CopC